MLDSVDVLCVNCHSMIVSELIDRHSKDCTRVTKQLILAENADALTEINFKIDRLRLNLEDHLQRSVFEPVSRSVFVKVVDLTTQLLEMTTDNVEEVRRISVFLQSYIRDYDGSISTLFYLERLYFLSSVRPIQTKFRELLLEIGRQEQQHDLHDKLELKKKELEAYKLEVEYLREKTNRLQAFIGSSADYQESNVESYTGSVSP